MKTQVSPRTGRRYPLTLICAVYRLSRSSVYAARPGLTPTTAAKRGPKTPGSDADLLTAIRRILAISPFHGEGYRKVRARLAHNGLRVGGKRVLRLMRQHQLLAPRRLGRPNGNPAHDGCIVTDRPNVMWGTDATRFYTTGGLVLVLRGGGPPYRRSRRLACGEARRSLGGPATTPRWRPGHVWRLRQGDCPRPADSL